MEYTDIELSAHAVSQLANQGDVVAQMKIRLEHFRNELGNCWYGVEMRYINQFIANIISDLSRIINDSHAVGDSIQKKLSEENKRVGIMR